MSLSRTMTGTCPGSARVRRTRATPILFQIHYTQTEHFSTTMSSPPGSRARCVSYAQSSPFASQHSSDGYNAIEHI
jgi:hypothetical protein